MVRRDKTITRQLTVAEITKHAQKIEKAIDPSRLTDLKITIEQARRARWGNYERFQEAPCEWVTNIKPTREKSDIATASARATEPKTAPNDFETKKKELQDMMKILNRIAQGEPWQNIPEVAAFGEPITAQEAAAALGEIKGQIAVDLLKSNDSMRSLLTQYGFKKEADDIQTFRDEVIIPAIAKSLK